MVEKKGQTILFISESPRLYRNACNSEKRLIIHMVICNNNSLTNTSMTINIQYMNIPKKYLNCFEIF